ncbi:MAG: CPBP family intramembrane glutamic endopeptidase [Promethearchaeota archaeon]
MSELYSKEKKQIWRIRFKFFYSEVLFAFILIFIILALCRYVIFPLFENLNLVFFGILYYIIRAIVIVLIILFVLWIRGRHIPENEKIEIYPLEGQLRLYKITRKNFKYQILYGVLLFFLVLLPLEFLSFLLMPDIVGYQVDFLSGDPINSYLFESNYLQFLFYAIIVQVSVVLAQESIYRGFLAKRGSDHFMEMSAVIISSLSFGMRTFIFYFDPLRLPYSPLTPVIWLIESFIIGIVFSLVTIRRKWLLPAIIAYILNNILFSHLIWNIFHGITSYTLLLFLYSPLFIGSVILLIWQYPRIRESISIGIGTLKSYLKKEDKKEKTTTDKAFRYQIDIIIGLVIFLLGFLISI